jgi:DNA-binding response OmpR family regulator
MTSRVLVADDDHDIARFVELNLSLEGFEVEVVHDGEAALAAVERQQPDLVLLDVMMPAAGRRRGPARLRANAATPRCPSCC